MDEHRLEILLEDIQSKLDLVLEGHAMLNNKIDHVAADLGERLTKVEKRLDHLEKKFNLMADELAAHRTDTEIHPRYHVAER